MFQKISLRVLSLLIVVMTSLAGRALIVQAQTLPGFSKIDMVYTFSDQAVFHASLQPAALVKSAYLFIQPAGERARSEKVILNEQGEISFIYDLKTHPLRPFAHTEYWFMAVSTNEDNISSLKNTFDYIDNRQTWQNLDNGEIQVNWLSGDLSFGQSALDTAVSGAKAAFSLLPGQNLKGLRVFIYDSAAHLQDSLTYEAASWTVGKASPDLGVVLVSIPPGIDQLVEMERQIPHEIMHILMYTIVKEKYSAVPIWMNEGLASLAETRPNPDYQRALKNAVKDNSLAPISTLCASFPQDASDAFLAYAQSASFVQFLQSKFGNNGLLELVNAYKDSYSCEEGVQASTGNSLSQLDYRWRQETLGVDTGSLAVQNLSPYLIVVAVLLVIPFLVVGISARKPRA